MDILHLSRRVSTSRPSALWGRLLTSGRRQAGAGGGVCRLWGEPKISWSARTGGYWFPPQSLWGLSTALQSTLGSWGSAGWPRAHRGCPGSLSALSLLGVSPAAEDGVRERSGTLAPHRLAESQLMSRTPPAGIRSETGMREGAFPKPPISWEPPVDDPSTDHPTWSASALRGTPTLSRGAYKGSPASLLIDFAFWKYNRAGTFGASAVSPTQDYL